MKKHLVIAFVTYYLLLWNIYKIITIITKYLLKNKNSFTYQKYLLCWHF